MRKNIEAIEQMLDILFETIDEMRIALEMVVERNADSDGDLSCLMKLYSINENARRDSQEAHDAARTVLNDMKAYVSSFCCN